MSSRGYCDFCVLFTEFSEKKNLSFYLYFISFWSVSVHAREDTGVIHSVEKAGLVDNTTESTSWIPNVTSKIK